MPYLGKNDHPADISDVKIVKLETIDAKRSEIFSMFPKRIGEIDSLDDEDEIEEFKYEEKLPVRLNGYTNLYEYDTFCYTNIPVCVKEAGLYKDKMRILVFY